MAQAGDSTRVRVAWGGPVARIWQGSITLSNGTLGELSPLGIQADEPGSMWIDGRRIMVHERSPRVYDGFDVTINGPISGAKLQVRLGTPDGEQQPAAIEIPLADVLGNAVSTDLDTQGTRLLVQRAPGDVLHVEFDRRHLVFAPGEFFSLRLRPNVLPGGSGGRRRLQVQLRPARSDQVIWEHQESSLRELVSIPIPLEVEEGAYDVVISAIELPSFQLRSVPLRLKKTVLATRTVQLLVLDPQPPAAPTEAETLRTVEEIDPANPKWWEKLTRPPQSLAKLPLGKWSRLAQGPLGSGDMGTRDHSLGRLAELGPSKTPEDVSWEAYTLPVEHLGKPHVLEVEYPSDVPQQFGVSLMEPNSAGALMPGQLDSGVSLSEEIISDGQAKPRMLRHRLIFWPRTEAPLVLITNRSATQPAVYGKIRVLDGWSRLPAAAVGQQQPGRLLAAYFDRPLFAASFCATEAYDESTQRSLDDWVTFHQGGARMIEYLRHVGHNGTMISVLCEGGALYPSRVAEPTPRYDKGPFFDSGQDPVRKDVLEMLFRLFDREGMRLIPAIEFASPLPELEAMLRAGGPQTEGIRWIGREGLTWEQVYRPHRRMAPYYNVLDPRVQQAMLRVVREIAHNYAGNHKSFAGLAVQLAGYGYGQLPGPDWGLDDATIARFERETGIRVPAAQGPARFARRHAYLTGPGRDGWLKWRSDNLGRFYHRLQAEILAVRPDARLYLTTAKMLDGPHWRARLRPTLSRPVTMDDVLYEAGINPAQFQNPGSPLVIRARCPALPCSPDASAAELALREVINGPAPREPRQRWGSLHYHRPREARLESFDAKSPYRPSYTVLRSQLVPSDHQNRRRFVRELAERDTHAMFDGGDLLPMGQQDALAGLVAVYRRLPAVAMKRLDASARQRSTQPVTVRYASHLGKTYVYAVNDSPVPVSLSVLVAAPGETVMEPLAENHPAGELVRADGRLFWRVALAPYDLVGGRLSAPAAGLSSPEVTIPSGVREALHARIRELGDRQGNLRIPPPLDSPANAGFEQPAGDGGAIVGWTSDTAEGAGVELHHDASRPNGPQVARLTSSGATMSLLSEPFTPPATGRLYMFVWLKVPDVRKQPSVEMVFEGRLHGEPYSLVGVLGRGTYPPKAIHEQWKRFDFMVEDLPLEGLSDLRVGLRLVGNGEVWVDDVELRHINFDSDELLQLNRVLSIAQTKLETNQISDCLRLLEGYWPCFLERHVPLRASVARRTTPDQSKPAERKPAKTGFLDKMRDKLTPRKWW